MSAKEDTIQVEFRQICTEHGCKCTPQRFAVFSYMRSNVSHPSVNQVWEHIRRQMPSITRESVFRILNELADYGMIFRLDKIESARYDGNAGNHGHLICEKCGRIIDVDLPEAMEISYPGFMVHHTELRVSGLCADCANKEKEQ